MEVFGVVGFSYVKFYFMFFKEKYRRLNRLECFLDFFRGCRVMWIWYFFISSYVFVNLEDYLMLINLGE